MEQPLYPTARKVDLVIQEMQDEVLVFDIRSNKAHCLNQTASKIWRYCDGKHSVSEIKNLLENNSAGNISDDLIWLAIDQLNDRELLEAGIEKRFEGKNRREVLKRIGLAAVVALPIVASITAPSAAMAAACSGVVTSCLGCNDGTPCNVNGDAMIGSCMGMGSTCQND